MRSTMLLPIILLLIARYTTSIPLEDFRSNLEFNEYSTNLDDPKYRLVDNVLPTYLNIDLDVYLNESRFNGLVEIHVEVTENLTQIALHQNVVSINTVSVLRGDSGGVVPLQFPNPFETDNYYELLVINFAELVTIGNYIIVISYNGQINENPFDRGFYKGYYFYQGQERVYATTQFQPYHARKAFPCFDEPQFKSRYVLSITRDSALSQSYSNMAINDTQEVGPGRIRETFLPTPIISAYLIAFHVSDFVATNSTSTAEKPFDIISRPGVLDQHSYAAEIGLEITNKLDEYLDFKYYDMGQGQPMKNDHIALPDFPSGAMENWGMVNYREAYLLYDENNTNQLNKIFIATIMAHELAHKWFGNLVTCFWWSNLWLNESFASFFEYFGAHYADNDLELDDQFVVDYVHSALTSDASASVTPMNWTDVADNPSISAHFSTTSYAKGASVLRMMEHFVGPETFKNALRKYLKTNQYQLGTPKDMYAAFKEAVDEDPTFAERFPGVDVEEVFDSWVQNPGSPVLNVDVDMTEGTITVSQERFQLTGEPANSLWHIPLTYTRSNESNFENTRPSQVLSERSTTIDVSAGHHWVIFNIAQSGLYRVNYDDHNWEMIASALRNNRETIHKLNRAQIVNDVLFFIRAGKIDFDRAFDVLSFLKDETDYYVWNGALTQLDWLTRRLEHIVRAHQEITTYTLNLLESAIEHVGYDEQESDKTSDILNRMQILNVACNLGHEGCIADSLEKWNNFKENNVSVPVNARRYVYCTGLREGDGSDYRFLLEEYNTSENTADMVVILRALACTRDESSLKDYLQQSLNNRRIRLHDRANAYSFALQGNRQNLPIVLEFTYDNYLEISEKYGGPARLSMVISYLSTYFTDFETISNFQEWLYTNQQQLGPAFSTGQTVINTSIANLEWGNSNAVNLFTILRSRNSAAEITAPLLLVFVTFVVHLIK